MRMLRLCFFALWIAASAAHAQAGDPWSKLQFLFGSWTGVAGAGDTQVGAGQGSYSFEPDLDRKIIVRRNSSTYDSGLRHQDLMVIYLDASDSTPRAIYFDSEGHVIRYNLELPSPNTAVFVSDAAQPGPRYRLTYWLEGESLMGKFEIAPPASDYKTYMKWASKRTRLETQRPPEKLPR